jgi:hypothetical protein
MSPFNKLFKMIHTKQSKSEMGMVMRRSLKVWEIVTLRDARNNQDVRSERKQEKKIESCNKVVQSNSDVGCEGFCSTRWMGIRIKGV